MAVKGTKRKLSQQQMAKDLGVSQTLVSMVLNGRREGIAPTSVEKILDYAKNNGYKPRGMLIEDSLLSDGPRLEAVGYILRSPLKLATKSNFFSHVHQGMYEELEEREIKTLFVGGEDDLNEKSLKKLADSKAYMKGVVVFGKVADALIQSLNASKIPTVSINARYSGLCHSVLPNERLAGEHLVDHLCKLGHRTFGWIGGNQSKIRLDERFNSMKAALETRGLDCPEHWQAIEPEADRQDGYNGAKKIFSDPENTPTALFCCNGLTARGAIDFLLQSGRRVGVDVSVVAFDMTRACTESLPKITCSSSHPEKMGAAAARLLLKDSNPEIEGYSELTLPVDFLELESTGRVSG